MLAVDVCSGIVRKKTTELRGRKKESRSDEAKDNGFAQLICIVNLNIIMLRIVVYTRDQWNVPSWSQLEM